MKNPGKVSEPALLLIVSFTMPQILCDVPVDDYEHAHDNSHAYYAPYYLLTQWFQCPILSTSEVWQSFAVIKWVPLLLLQNILESLEILHVSAESPTFSASIKPSP